MTEKISCADSTEINRQTECAGFWLRAVAYFIDWLILAMAGFMFSQLFSSIWFHLALPLGYFAGFNSSKYQGTAGKIIVGIKITDLNGNRISVLRALARYCFPHLILVFQVLCFIYFWSASFANNIGEGMIALGLLLVSFLVFFAGYVMTAFTARKQALHDIVCGTLVVRSGK